jgi:hypothetical protein
MNTNGNTYPVANLDVGQTPGIQPDLENIASGLGGGVVLDEVGQPYVHVGDEWPTSMGDQLTEEQAGAIDEGAAWELPLEPGADSSTLSGTGVYENPTDIIPAQRDGSENMSREVEIVRGLHESHQALEGAGFRSIGDLDAAIASERANSTPDFERLVGLMTIAERYRNADTAAQRYSLMTEIDRLQEQLERADLDTQTGLYSKNAWEKAQQGIEQNPNCTILSLDAGNLTEYNNTYGHPVGNEMLQRYVEAANRAVNRCNELYTVVDYPQTDGRFKELLIPDRSKFRPGGDEVNIVVVNVNVKYLQEIVNERTGAVESVEREAPLAQVLNDMVKEEFDNEIVCGSWETTTVRIGADDENAGRKPVRMAVCNVTGGFADGGKGDDGGVRQFTNPDGSVICDKLGRPLTPAGMADRLSQKEKMKNRMPDMLAYVLGHTEMALERNTGNTVQISGREVIIQYLNGNTVKQIVDEIVVDKSTSIKLEPGFGGDPTYWGMSVEDAIRAYIARVSGPAGA